MLRWIVRTPRAHGEEWVNYIARATHTSEQLAASHGSPNWVILQRKRKWQFARKAAGRTDGRWTCRLLAWRPWFRCAPRRCVGHPAKRWGDDLAEFAGDGWSDAAANDDLWEAALSGFVDYDASIWRSRAYH